MNKYELIDKVVAEIAKDKGISEGEVGTYDTLMRVAEIAVKNCSIPDVSQQHELLLAYHRYLTEELSLDLHELWVDKHLKANNCG
jgi:hypothetical protein